MKRKKKPTTKKPTRTMSEKIDIKESKPKEPEFVMHQNGALLFKATGWKKAKEALAKAEEEQEQLVNVSDTIKGLLWDIYIQLNMALSNEFGYTEALGEGFWGTRPPSRLSIKTGPVAKNGTQPEKRVYIGKLAPPAWEGGFISMNVNPNDPMSLNIGGTVKKKFEASFMNIMQDTKKRIKTDSIYQAQPLELNLDWYALVRNGMPFDLAAFAPQFIPDVDNPPALILPRDLENSLNIDIWGIIRNPDDFRHNKVPVKAGAMFSGPPGTGKTLAALHTAKVAVESGWTYFKLTNPQFFIEAYNIAQFYAPCILVTEDVERIFGEPRTEYTDLVLDRLDGVATKGSEVIAICTSNYPQKLCKAVTRPGRIGRHIQFRALDGDAAGRFIQTFCGEWLADDANTVRAGEAFDGLVPADITEGVNRAKRIAIAKLGRDIRGKITTEMLQDGAELVKRDKGLWSPESNVSQEELNLRIVQGAFHIAMGHEIPVDLFRMAAERWTGQRGPSGKLIEKLTEGESDGE